MSTDVSTGESTSGPDGRRNAAPLLIEPHDGGALVPALHLVLDPDALPAERSRMHQLTVKVPPSTAAAEPEGLLEALRGACAAVPVLDGLAARFDLRGGEVSIVAHGATVTVAEIASPPQLWRRLVSSDGMIVVAVEAGPASIGDRDHGSGVHTILAARLPVHLG